jgi:hypothetical protein
MNKMQRLESNLYLRARTPEAGDRSQSDCRQFAV